VAKYKIFLLSYFPFEFEDPKNYPNDLRSLKSDVTWLRDVHACQRILKFEVFSPSSYLQPVLKAPFKPGLLVLVLSYDTNMDFT
jgi:hypothetical protein